MQRWINYIRERYPLPTFIALVTGISLSGIFLENGIFHFIPFLMSFIGLLLFFGLLRLMDEVKDFDKDSILHPDRPLPRGLIKKDEAINVIFALQVILLAYSMIVWIALQEAAALAYAGIVGYSWLMYKEFFVEHWLSRHPIIHGISHQLIVFPMTFFAVEVNRPYAIADPTTWSLALMWFGAFFCYQICRKLDPHTHPILNTYVHFYGFRRAFEMAAIALAISAMGATALNLSLILLPCEIIVLLSLALLFFQIGLFRIPETAAGISLMLHVWAIPIYRYI